MNLVRKPQRLFICSLLILALFPLGGCSGSITANYRDVSSLQPVQVLGVDKEDKDFRVTISTGEWGDQKSSTIISRNADTIITSLRSIQDYSGKNEIYYQQIRFILLGDNMTKDTISRLRGFLENSDMIRLDSSMFVVKGDTAKNLIVESGDQNYDITECLAALKESSGKRGEWSNFTCSEIFRSLSVCKSALVSAVEMVSIKNDVFSKGGESTAIPAGYAILKDNEICGYIDRDDCILGANILLNKYGDGPGVIKEGSGRAASLYLDSGKTKYSAQWENGRIKKLTADIKITAQLLSPGTEATNTSDKYYEALKTKLADETIQHCKNVLNLSRVLRSDFLWLGPTLRAKYPKEYKQMAGDFTDNFSSAEIEVNVSVKIETSIVDKSDDKTKKG